MRGYSVKSVRRIYALTRMDGELSRADFDVAQSACTTGLRAPLRVARGPTGHAHLVTSCRVSALILLAALAQRADRRKARHTSPAAQSKPDGTYGGVKL
jgi:hypothetical protein